MKDVTRPKGAEAMRKVAPEDRLPRRTLFDALESDPSENLLCRISDLTNEAAVETFFVSRLLKHLGYSDRQIKPKHSIESLTVAKGHKKLHYKPDYVLVVDRLPRCVIDAKDPGENLDDWVEQCSGYCLALNRRHEASNPVKWFALSNGIATRIYEWDKDRPLLSLDFADFQWGNPKFERIKTLIGASVVSQSSAKDVGVKSEDFAFTKPPSERARQLFSLCHRVIWKSEVSGPQPSFMEFVKVMFVKLWADRQLRDNPATRSYFDGRKDSVLLPASAVTFSVKWIEARENEGAINPIDSILFARLRDDIEREISLWRKKRIFNKNERIDLKPQTVKEIVRRLEHVDMFGIDEDLNGRLFETFLSATMRGKDLGQFFTPRSVVKMMTRVARLHCTPEHQDRVLDACCGSGGFLIEALTMMRNQVRANASLSPDQRDQLISTLCSECLFGVDAGKQPPLARIARINMYLHGDGGSRIYYADALDKQLLSPHGADPEIVQNVGELRDRLQAGLRFHVVLTNPPFSMSKELRNEADKKILSVYDLAKKDRDSVTLRSSLRSSVMFLERYYDLLLPGGMLLTVIDDTLLASANFNFVRDFIRERFLIRAIISLPGDAFRRQGSRVKTSVLVLERKGNLKDAQPSCYAYFSEHLGVDDLTPRASLADIQTARERAETESDNILKGFEAYLSGRKGPGLVLKAQQVSDRLDLKYASAQVGRMVEAWRSRGVEVKRLDALVRLASDPIAPAASPTTDFKLLKVSYEGRCQVEREAKGNAIKAPLMYRVKAGQMIFSTIRATDGAIGIVPEEMDGGLVSDTSYAVFDWLGKGTPLDMAYLWAILRSYELRADMQSLSPGSGRYTTYWPEVGEICLPWFDEPRRREIGAALLQAWEKEKQAPRDLQAALAKLDPLEVESDSSKMRWKVSKAPT
jgi:type I restriction enzyme M protein